MVTNRQKLKLAKLIERIGGNPTAYFAEQIDTILGRLDDHDIIPSRIDELDAFFCASKSPKSGRVRPT